MVKHKQTEHEIVENKFKICQKKHFCTFLASKDDLLQDTYHCYTCNLENVCVSCLRSCHVAHKTKKNPFEKAHCSCGALKDIQMKKEEEQKSKSETLPLPSSTPTSTTSKSRFVILSKNPAPNTKEKTESTTTAFSTSKPSITPTSSNNITGNAWRSTPTSNSNSIQASKVSSLPSPITSSNPWTKSKADSSSSNSSSAHVCNAYTANLCAIFHKSNISIATAATVSKLDNVLVTDLIPLPLELVVEVLSYLNGFDLARLSQVNKTAYSIITDDFWCNAYKMDFFMDDSSYWWMTHRQKTFQKSMRKFKKDAVYHDKTWREAYMLRSVQQLCVNCSTTYRSDQNTQTSCHFVPSTRPSRCQICGDLHDLRGSYWCGKHEPTKWWELLKAQSIHK